MNILVTGVTAGFGKAIAELLISKGHTVIGTGRRQEKLDELQTQLGDNFIPLNFDVSDLPATKTALQTLRLIYAITLMYWSITQDWRWDLNPRIKQTLPIGNKWSIPIF